MADDVAVTAADITATKTYLEKSCFPIANTSNSKLLYDTELAKAFARHAATARIEGARLGIEAAADRAYLICAQTRHVTLGDQCRNSILALDPTTVAKEADRAGD